jgi:hypothetical protein
VVIVRFLFRLCLSVAAALALLWLACGVPSYFGAYPSACGHNAYLWLPFAFVGIFAVLSVVPRLRFMGGARNRRRSAS